MFGYETNEQKKEKWVSVSVRDNEEVQHHWAQRLHSNTYTPNFDKSLHELKMYLLICFFDIPNCFHVFVGVANFT